MKSILIFAIVGFLAAIGSPGRAFAQGMPHQIEHPYAPPSIRETILRARTASTAELNVEPVHGNVYAIFGAGGNITASVGPDGILLVNTGEAAMAARVLDVVKKLGEGMDPTPGSPPVPIRVIVNTDALPANTGGNEKIQAAAQFITGGGGGGTGGEHIMAHENVLARMSEPLPGSTKSPRPSDAWPTDTFRGRTTHVGRFFNGEGVQLIHTPNAHTDGDSIVWFRYSDVIATGDIFSTTGWPVFDLQKGGSFQGIIGGLNLILQTGLLDFKSEGGTMIVPGHGRIGDLADVAFYRDMLTIVRDRIQDEINRGFTLDQVKAARPTQGWDNRYGSKTGPWTTDMFIEAAYKSLSQKKGK
jgi:glyoxylase-like metal-dependent hydrolase (beta-lactamase superfamily II)